MCSACQGQAAGRTRSATGRGRGRQRRGEGGNGRGKKGCRAHCVLPPALSHAPARPLPYAEGNHGGGSGGPLGFVLATLS